ncbi:MAG: AMP-binding protein [Candidatus Omnitrophica bacterium]|nr:AMP-binding protein [Candidatus Omnitrophota bacterium]
MLVNEFLANSARQYPNKLAVVYQKERLNYSELDKLSGALAIKLVEIGLKKGDRVALFLENSHEYLISFFGILKAGGVVVPLNTQFVSRELTCLLNDCSPRFVIADSAHQSVLKGLIDSNFILLIDKLDLSHYHGSWTMDYGLSDSDLAMILYTSGTTGQPKGVMLSHKNLNANADSIIEYLGLCSSDSMMVVLPFYYSYGTSLLTTHIKVGGTLVIDNRFLYPNVILETMEKEGVTGFAGVPSHYNVLLRKSALRKYKLSTLRYVTQAGGAMAPAMIKEFREIVSHAKFYVMYGQTEAAARLTYQAPEFLEKKLGSTGKAIPGVELEILDEQGKKVNIGEIGEIVARGANIMSGYWNSPEETKSVLRKEGLWTGDLARIDEDGFIYLVARKKEMIKSGANRISPFEIEEVICQMPGITECAAVGIPDEILGEAIKLFVVKNGVNITDRDIMFFCKKNFASYKIPKEIEFLPSLPKTSAGKIRKKELV